MFAQLRKALRLGLTASLIFLAAGAEAQTVARACWSSWATARPWKACCCRVAGCACPAKSAAPWAACSA